LPKAITEAEASALSHISYYWIGPPKGEAVEQEKWKEHTSTVRRIAKTDIRFLLQLVKRLNSR